jgi:2-(1,2-epoxy-1,2-dihydrophenyl)acetyl-CoA isomerase
VVGFDGPIVVAVRGAVAGASMVFPLGADHVIGDATALFVFAHIGIALSPDGGVSSLLPKVVGERSARSLLLTGGRVKADDALRLGLLNQIVAAEELDAKAIAVARRLASGPQRAIRLTKQLVREGAGRSLADQLDAETDGIVASVSEEDFREGVTAFLDKRPPSFPSAR